MKKALFLAVCATLAGPVQANEFEPQIRSFFEENIVSWIGHPTVVRAIKAQNTRTNNYSLETILEMDGQWRSEVGTSRSDLVNSVVGNETADFVREQVHASGGVITELFLMDAQGLNVAASGITSDM